MMDALLHSGVNDNYNILRMFHTMRLVVYKQSNLEGVWYVDSISDGKARISRNQSAGVVSLENIPVEQLVPLWYELDGDPCYFLELEIPGISEEKQRELIERAKVMRGVK